MPWAACYTSYTPCWPCLLQELGGGNRIEPLWLYYYPNTRAMIFMVDSKRIATLGTAKCEYCRGKYCTTTEYATDRPLLHYSKCQNDSKYWLWHMLYLRRNILHRLHVQKSYNWEQRHKDIEAKTNWDLPEDAPLLVFANKQDLPGSVSAEQVAERLGLETKRIEFDVDGMCARLMTNV